MLFIRNIGFILSLIFIFALNAKAETCLTYKTLGDSSCQGGAVSKTEVIPKKDKYDILRPIVVNPVNQEKPKVIIKEVIAQPKKKAKSELTLDDKIDEYLKNYNKPPREFIAFNLEPTLENALKWAKKYRELMERNKKLNKAWGQAQVLLDKMEKSGKELEGYTPLPSIPDYGIPLPKANNKFVPEFTKPSFMANPTNNISNKQATIEKKDSAINQGASKLYGKGSLTPNLKSDKAVEISYYFSAKCPYCKKLEVGLKPLIKELADSVTVTCVDMSPKERKIENVYGKVDCAWRPLLKGEAKALGVTSTPTLIINRHLGKGLEKIEGVVNIDKLRSFILGEG